LEYNFWQSFFLNSFNNLYFSSFLPNSIPIFDCAIAQAVSLRLPTATARVRFQVRSYGLCWWTKWHRGRFASSSSVFPSSFSFHRLFHTRPLSAVGTGGPAERPAY
jgi:hypothetical protein